MYHVGVGVATWSVIVPAFIDRVLTLGPIVEDVGEGDLICDDLTRLDEVDELVSDGEVTLMGGYLLPPLTELSLELEGVGGRLRVGLDRCTAEALG